MMYMNIIYVNYFSTEYKANIPHQAAPVQISMFFFAAGLTKYLPSWERERERGG